MGKKKNNRKQRRKQMHQKGIQETKKIPEEAKITETEKITEDIQPESDLAVNISEPENVITETPEPGEQSAETPEPEEHSAEIPEPEEQGGEISEPGEHRGETPQSEESQQDRETLAGFSWKKFWMWFGGGVAGLLIVVYIVGIFYFQDKFLMNTYINGIDASYVTVDVMEKEIGREADKYAITLKMRDGSQETIRAEQIGYTYVPDGEIQDFKNSQPPYSWPVALFKETDYTYESATAFDNKKVKEAMNNLECCSEENTIVPENAYLDFQDNHYVIVEEKQGRQVKKKKLLKVLKKAIAAGAKSFALEKNKCYAEPEITKDDENLNKLKDNLNYYADIELTYTFGEVTEVLDGGRISQWLSYDEEGNVTLDETQIPIYVAELAEKYDTYNKAKEFKTYDGTVVRVTGGSYGWRIDQSAESENLLQTLKNGTSGEKTVAFAQTAASWENCDLGNTYVEVDLTNQCVVMYVDGSKIVESPMVSGLYTNLERRTPPGTFSLYYKKSPAVLRSNKPGDSYESPVTFWMPFNGGIGLHDASWRGTFGGSIYKYNGSHGCINLPYKAAETIYRNIEAGTPVICYYR